MNGWRLEMTDQAMEDMADMPPAQLPAVLRALRHLARNPSGSNIKKLAAPPDTGRLRVGSWRVFFEFRRNEHIIKILSVTDRKDAY